MEYIEIGKICNTHGIKGELKVQVYTDFTQERFKTGSTIYIGEKHIAEKVESYRFHKGFMLLLLKDKKDINFVEHYKNMYIYKNKEDIKPLEDGFYFNDLIDLDVYCENTKVGKVIAVEQGSRNNFIRILKEDEKEALIPFIEQFILNTDLSLKRIDIVKMDGLL